MAKFKIICDSAADIPKEAAEKLNIRVLPLSYTFDGETYLKDGVDMTKEEFFEKMRAEEIIPKTSQVTAPEWEAAMREELEKTNTLICFTMSSAASGTCQSANIAKNEVLATNPDADITVIDSMSLSYAYGIAIEKAAAMANEETTKEEFLEEYERIFAKVHYFFLVEDLKFLKKGGRINTATLVAANIMDIKPILTIKDGLVVSCDKMRGGKKLYDKFMQMYLDKGHLLAGKEIYIVHSLTEDRLNEYIDSAERILMPGKINVVQLGATIGAHAGPGLSAVLYVKD